MTAELSSLLTLIGTLAASYYGCAMVIMILVEVAAQITGRRARTLRRHLVFLFGRELTSEILTNPLVRKADDDQLSRLPGWRRKTRVLLKSSEVPIPYIDPRDFALALMQVALKPEEVRERARVRELDGLRAIPSHARSLLETLLQGTNGNPAHIQERFEGWFRRDQAQLSARYGARSRIFGFFSGAALALLVGLDTISIVASYLHSAKICCLLATVPELGNQMAYFAGYAISGLMISQGSSFWFDILGQVTNLRSEGARPKT